MTPGQLLRSARGFTSLFWGIPMMLLLMSGAVSIQSFSYMRLPPYLIGVLIMYMGMMFLYRMSPPTPRWRRLVRQGILFSFLLVYFSPIVHWWLRRPDELFYLLNMFLLIVCVSWGLLVINLLAAELGRRMDDRAFLIEAQLCGWAAVTLVIGPALAIGTIAVIEMIRAKCGLYEGVLYAYHAVPHWILALFLLPFTLTMASSWQAKRRCIVALKQLDAE